MTDKFFKNSVLGLLISIFIFLFFQHAVFGGNPEQIVFLSHNSVSNPPQSLSVTPVAVPVLTQEDAEKANQSAVRMWNGVLRKKSFEKSIGGLVEFFQKNCWCIFLVLLFPFVLFLWDIAFPRINKKINEIWNGYFSWSRRFFVLISVYLFCFGLTVFVPWSVYFGNSQQFPFIFNDFLGLNIFFLSCVVILVSVILLAVPPRAGNWLTAIIAGIGICVYLQAMFMNCFLGEMDGEQIEWNEHVLWGIINVSIWGLIIAGTCVCIKIIPASYRMIVSFATGCILLLEITATVSMVVSSSDSVWKRNDQYFLDGSKQFQLSAEKNIIVLVMDALGSGYLRYVFEENPALQDVFKDFTWYCDARSNYQKTFPALPSELTGQLIQPGESIDDIFNYCWNSPSAVSFYNQVKKAGFDPRLYIDKSYSIGSEEFYLDYFSNIHKQESEIIVNSLEMSDCLIQISGFSALPYLLKKYFFYDHEFAENVIRRQLKNDSGYDLHIPQRLDRYLNKMRSSTITTDADSPVISFHYTYGAHTPWNYDEKCLYHDSPFSEPFPTVKACLYLISEMIRLLKEQNIYNQTAIIICSDHGSKHKEYSTPFDMTLMIKPFNVSKANLTIDVAKAQGLDILPSLLEIACEDDADFSAFIGCPVNSIPPDRKRFVYNISRNSKISSSFRTERNENCVDEFIFDDVESFNYKKAFVRSIPLDINIPIKEDTSTSDIDTAQ